MMEQLSFDLETEQVSPLENPALWTPRDIWVRLNQHVMEVFKEDRRIERKDYKAPSLDELAICYSMFSNSPDGGLLIYGVANNGEVTGCEFTSKQLNSIERCHITHCPGAKPEWKKVPVIVKGKQCFCLAIFIPYVGKLVETNKGDAWIRYGESRHKMSNEEAQDFRSTRHELSFELTIANAYQYPDDFDLRMIQDFCDAFRDREIKPLWTNEEVLVDRHLIRKVDGVLKPLNTLVLLAAKDPSLTIPGCRVRIQRFESNVEGSGENYSPLKDVVVEGNLQKVIQESQESIAALIYDVTWLSKEGKFVTTPEYPQWAWLEALVNACVHRSYSFSGTETTVKIFADRMEIESPGGFVPPVSETTIYSTRASRNHHLMEALRILGHVRMSREGTRRIRDSMRDYQLPEPLFRQESMHGVVVKVTLKNDQGTRQRASSKDVAMHFGVDVWKELAEHEIKIAAFAFRNNGIQVNDAVRLTGRTWKSSKKDLERLAGKGVLVFKPGTYVRDPKAKYKLAEARSEKG